MKQVKTNPNDTYNWTEVHGGIDCPDCGKLTVGSMTQWREDGVWALLTCAYCRWAEWRRLKAGRKVKTND